MDDSAPLRVGMRLTVLRGDVRARPLTRLVLRAGRREYVARFLEPEHSCALPHAPSVGPGDVLTVEQTSGTVATVKRSDGPCQCLGALVNVSVRARAR